MLFRDGIDLATYRDDRELSEKARFYLKHEKLREEIAARGREVVHANHPYRHRMETILKTVAGQEMGTDDKKGRTGETDRSHLHSPSPMLSFSLSLAPLPLALPAA